MFSLKACDLHKNCKNCMGDYLKSKIEDGKVLKIACMHYKCPKEFTQEDVQQFGSGEIYNKFLKFKENINVELDPNLRWCPKNGCINYVRRQKKCCCFASSATCSCG